DRQRWVPERFRQGVPQGAAARLAQVDNEIRHHRPLPRSPYRAGGEVDRDGPKRNLVTKQRRIASAGRVNAQVHRYDETEADGAHGGRPPGESGLSARAPNRAEVTPSSACEQ